MKEQTRDQATSVNQVTAVTAINKLCNLLIHFFN